ncbi:hypothetical protein [Castellaniella sp.]|jgi:hypothetical protein|uniref:hypothetical protein n=1 Tax=Castellaniella sp. TaxID=1955812 RepID=UPI002AFF7538|nr:hypothetical protein [Castellaniella sp.]
MKKAAAQPITDAQLEQALSAAGLDIPLGDAMRSPALARCLEITAEALLVERDHDGSNPQPSRGPRRLVGPHESLPPRVDVKRAAAGDRDE